ncbi:hypothetical protein W02_25420 [Nitrospira sp. KM1]|uniref:hypothetical protein n=1 Tax=Nitrospira sp. KM1 TaxID=1936990 RepID=UPI0013A70F25|nr:hypothetical protein [Nitrospira sp. KM1]BCA55402.1 hypothetical protein W02_25420 [Nitrospira sp. KM1]
MGVKKGDLIDERKRHPHACGLVVKVMGGGAGFEKVVCCDHELTEEDLVSELGSRTGRTKGTLLPATVIDEKKLYPDSCGLRVMIMDGGAGFKEIRCCGHSLTASSVRELNYGQLRASEPKENSPPGHA